jgi:hypothetical protein
MKISIELDMAPHLTPGEIDQFRKQCEQGAVQPPDAIADLIRAALAASEKEEAA